MEKQDTECEEILISYTHLTKDLCPKYIKSSYQKNFFFKKFFFNLKTIKITGHLSQGNIQIANNHRKRCSTLLVIKQIRIKTTVKYHYTTIRMATIKKI